MLIIRGMDPKSSSLMITRRDTYRETYWESGFGENREWKEECALGGLERGPETSTALCLCTWMLFSLFKGLGLSRCPRP